MIRIPNPQAYSLSHAVELGINVAAQKKSNVIFDFIFPASEMIVEIKIIRRLDPKKKEVIYNSSFAVKSK